ncbi:Protein of unknown function [Granulicella rosea]|uniref:DUF2442 domain-containing protein n=1 Tax=Granulicella rosea TaxID=474952 RepID=A0A239INM7_9BACT|nr:DUF2442 domain-containing protein [Granulicella rosea]SNS95159.1 Protein of unknown function [Granulicella rosea]
MTEEEIDTATKEMIEGALERAKSEPKDDRVTATAVRFDAALRLLLITLSNGRRLTIPQEDLQHLANASVEDASDVTIEMRGRGIHWEKLDLDFSVQGLIEGRRGNAQWMKDFNARLQTNVAA